MLSLRQSIAAAFEVIKSGRMQAVPTMLASTHDALSLVKAAEVENVIEAERATLFLVKVSHHGL